MRLPARWSGDTHGLWIATPTSKVRHLHARSAGMMYVTECNRDIPWHREGRIVNGDRYDRLPPCKECLAAIRDRRDWWQSILEQQGAA